MRKKNYRRYRKAKRNLHLRQDIEDLLEIFKHRAIMNDSKSRKLYSHFSHKVKSPIARIKGIIYILSQEEIDSNELTKDDIINIFSNSLIELDEAIKEMEILISYHVDTNHFPESLLNPNE